MDPDEFRNALLAGIFLVVGALAVDTVVGGVPLLLAVVGFLVPIAYALDEFVLHPEPTAGSDSAGE